MSTIRTFEGSARTREARRRLHRRRRRRRRAFMLLGVLALAVAVAIAFPLLPNHAGDVRHRPTSKPNATTENNALTQAVGPIGGYAGTVAPPNEQVHLHFRVEPRAGILFDLKTGKVLWARNPQHVVPIASLTKMMTALVVVKHESPREKVRITHGALAYQGSGVGVLPPGKHVPLETLLYGLMLPSGNDAAIALAQKVAHTPRHFVRLMNAQAHKLGLTCTHFASPDGLNDRNRSCAHDLALLARAVLRQRRLARIVGTHHATRLFPIKHHKLFLTNNNPLMRLNYRGVTGIKTGLTNKAGHCLVASARRGHKRLGLVLLHSPDTGKQGSRLLDAGFRVLR